MNADLKSRLLHIEHGDGGSQWPRNPDGAEAVKEIEKLGDQLDYIEREGTEEINAAVDLRSELAKARVEIERLRDQLEWYADKALLARAEKMTSDSGIAALREDAGERAREALRGGDENGK